MVTLVILETEERMEKEEKTVTRVLKDNPAVVMLAQGVTRVKEEKMAVMETAEDQVTEALMEDLVIRDGLVKWVDKGLLVQMVQTVHPVQTVQNVKQKMAKMEPMESLA